MRIEYVSNDCRELKCPKGMWTVNWLAELKKHVRPEIASQVKQLMEILIQVLFWALSKHRCA
jgi:hypothetical protein